MSINGRPHAYSLVLLTAGTSTRPLPFPSLGPNNLDEALNFNSIDHKFAGGHEHYFW